MNTTTVSVRALRNVSAGMGQDLTKDAVAEVEPLAAAILLDMGAVELTHPSGDRPKLDAAIRRENELIQQQSRLLSVGVR
jgi:hypothetical protein